MTPGLIIAGVMFATGVAILGSALADAIDMIRAQQAASLDDGADQCADWGGEHLHANPDTQGAPRNHG